MLTGRLFIDGLDAYSTWGVYIASGGFNELIAYPPLKDVPSNDWQEEDGEEADLSAPVLNCSEPTVLFAFAGSFSRVHDFINHLASRTHHEFNCASIGRTYSLRMVQSPNFTQLRDLGTFSVKFSNDFPLKGYTYQSPQSNIVPQTGYLLDDTPFSAYGCRMKRGTLAEVMKPAAVKTNLLRNISTQSGVIYDDEEVTFKSKEIRLHCLMRADTLPQLWRNYDALLYNLTRPGERRLEVSEAEHTFSCYYQRASVTAFYPTDKIWIEFTLYLAAVGNLRPQDDCLLATEDAVLLVTQDAINHIDLYPTK